MLNNLLILDVAVGPYIAMFAGAALIVGAILFLIVFFSIKVIKKIKMAEQENG